MELSPREGPGEAERERHPQHRLVVEALLTYQMSSKKCPTVILPSRSPRKNKKFESSIEFCNAPDVKLPNTFRYLKVESNSLTCIKMHVQKLQSGCIDLVLVLHGLLFPRCNVTRPLLPGCHYKYCTCTGQCVPGIDTS